MRPHTHTEPLSIVCVHLREGMHWYGIPTTNEFFDWLCKRCLEKYAQCTNRLDEIQAICPTCIRQMQGNTSTLHYPVQDGSSFYYED
jgi:hypothetical protein